LNRVIAFLLAMVFACALLPAHAADRAPLTVFAAASLKESFDEAALAYEKRTGTPVRVSYAASSALARQIDQGAPADVFVSADLDWMDTLQGAKRIDVASRRNLLGNTLVLIAPATSKVGDVALKPGVDLAPLLGDGRLALALTGSVPAGKYAKQSLMHLGAWEGVKAHTAEAENVRAALLLVARGEAPLGIVYGSDARAEPKVRVVGTFPATSHAPIVYPVARVATSTHPRAADFVRWLQSKDARAIFLRHGFQPL
jgi:molybdate transport system substrate-binding protein